MSARTTEDDTRGFRQRLIAKPRPAVLWVGVLLVLFGLEFGAFVQGMIVVIRGTLDIVPSDPLVPLLTELLQTADTVPTLLDRSNIPNQGHRTGANGPWVNTFPENLPFFESGLEPKWAWLIRFLLTFAYSAALFGWIAYGYRVYRRHYRPSEWTPRDDVIRRFRNHRWGIFGAIIVFLFVTMALFSPTLGPTTVATNIESPYSNHVTFFNEETGEIEEVYVGTANGDARSAGAGSNNVGPWNYDDFGRWHPFGTMTDGKDLFTFMMAGARVSLFIGILAISVSGLAAAIFAMLTAYYKGLVDLVVVVAGDSVMSIPQLLLLILLSAVFADHWLGQIYNGGFIIALIFGFTSWPFMWRAVRGPAFQVSTQEWIDAARSYGQSPRKTMQKHMLPYVVGYLLVYASMTLGGIIIATSALSFLGSGLGVYSPTPEWGRAIALGQDYIATQSWHVSMIPGLMIVLVVTAFNALGDGIRDAIDPQSGVGDEGGEGAVAAGGGGG